MDNEEIFEEENGELESTPETLAFVRSNMEGVKRIHFAYVMNVFFGVDIGERFGLSKSKKRGTSPIQEGHVTITYSSEDIGGRETTIKKVIDTTHIIYDYIKNGHIQKGEAEGHYEVAIRKWLGDEVSNVNIGGKEIMDFESPPISKEEILETIFSCVEFFFRNPKSFEKIIPASSKNGIDSERLLAIYTGQDEIKEMFASIKNAKNPDKAYKTFGMELFKSELSRKNKNKDNDGWIKRTSPKIMVRYGTSAWENIKMALEHKTSSSFKFNGMEPYDVVDKLDFCVINSYKYVDIAGVTQPKTDTVVNIGQIKVDDGGVFIRYVGDLKFSLKKQFAKGLEGGSLLDGKGISITSATGLSGIDNIFKRLAIHMIDVSPKSDFYVKNDGRLNLISKVEIVKKDKFVSSKPYWEYKNIPMIYFMSFNILGIKDYSRENFLNKALSSDVNIKKVGNFIRALYGGIAESYVSDVSKAYGDWEANVFFEYGKVFNSFEDIIKNFKIIPKQNYSNEKIAYSELITNSVKALDGYVVRIKYAKTTKEGYEKYTAKMCEEFDKEVNKIPKYTVSKDLKITGVVYLEDAKINERTNVISVKSFTEVRNWQEAWDVSIGEYEKKKKRTSTKRPPAFRNERNKMKTKKNFAVTEYNIFYIYEHDNKKFVFAEPK